MDKNLSYTSTAKFLHWLMAFIWIAVWIMGVLAVYGKQTFNPNHGLTAWHKAIASTLLLLIVIRIIWRLFHTPPALPNSMSKHVKYMVKGGHFILYLIALLAMPMSGWLLSSFAGRPVLVAGILPLPALSAPNPDYVGIIREIHTYLAWFCAILVVGHILLALKHHFIDKDTVLTSMLPNHGKK